MVVLVRVHRRVPSMSADSKTRVEAAGGIQHPHQVSTKAPACGARAVIFQPVGKQNLDHGEGRLRDPFVFAVQVRRYVCCRRLVTQGAGSGGSSVGKSRN